MSQLHDSTVEWLPSGPLCSEHMGGVETRHALGGWFVQSTRKRWPTKIQYGVSVDFVQRLSGPPRPRAAVLLYILWRVYNGDVRTPYNTKLPEDRKPWCVEDLNRSRITAQVIRSFFASQKLVIVVDTIRVWMSVICPRCNMPQTLDDSKAGIKSDASNA